MLTSLRQDLKYAFRTLAHNRGFAAVSVLALALGIGANSAIFTVVNSVLLQPLRFSKPEELVLLRERNLQLGFPRFSLSPGNYQTYRDENRSFRGITAFNSRGMNFSGGSEPERLRVAQVTTNFFDVLGAHPSAGRQFTAQEGQLGSEHVVILSDALWKRRFGGRSDIIGQTVKLDNESYTVIGMMPADFRTPGRVDLWAPLAMNQANWTQRGGHYLAAIGRLKEGVSLSAADSDLNTIAARLQKEFPGSNRGWDTTVQGLQDAAVENVRPAMITLLAAVGFVLLIACVNVANLLLSRSAARRREIGVRAALGAGKGRLVRQFLTEAMLLAAAGAAAGLVLAWAGVRLLIYASPDFLPRVSEIALDWRAVAFTAGVAVLTGLLFGVAPALSMARSDLISALRDGGRGHSVGFQRNSLRSALVVGEVALALVLLSGATLLMRSFYRLQSVDPGFDPHGVLTFRTNLPEAKYPGFDRKAAFYDLALEKLAALPGVSAVGAGSIFPLGGNDFFLSFDQIGKPPKPPGEGASVTFYAVTPGYFAALKIPLKAGRYFNAHDRDVNQQVAIVSETMARQYYPNENPLGQRVKVSMGRAKPAEIVGIVGDVRDSDLESKGRAAIYQPAAQIPFGSMSFAVRTAAGAPESLFGAVRAAIREMDSELPVDAMGTVDALVDQSLSQRRFAMVLMATFACLALLLAMIGIYGVMSYAVAQATQEIGIRLALGAGARDVLGLVLRYGGLMMGVGLVIGIGAALAAGRLLSAQLFEVRSSDPTTYAIVSAALVATGLAACLVPAWRAIRVDPLVALRSE